MVMKGACAVVKRFSLLKGFKKGLVAAGAVAVGMIGAVETLGGTENLTKITVITGVSAVVMGFRMGLNWWKVNQELADKRYVR